MEKIIFFIAFLLVYILYIWVSAVLANRYLKTLKKSGFWENELLIVVPLIFFFAFLFIIGRFFNLNFLLLSVLFSNIGLIITSIIWSLIGSPGTPFKEIGGWAGGDFGVKNVWLTIVSQATVIVILIAFPIIVGVKYFSVSEAELMRIYAVKASLILLLGSYILSLPILIGVLSASFIDEDTRARYFLNQFSSVIAYSLFVSLLFNLFKWGETEQQIQLGSLNFSLSPQMFFGLLGFILIFLILPYFIGIQKAKRLKAEFLEINKRLLGNIVDTINLSAESNILSSIEKLEKQIVVEYKKLIESDKGVEIGVKYDEIDSDKDVAPIEVLRFQYYKIARQYDTRMNFFDFLNNTYLKLEEMKSLNQSGGPQNEELIDKYVAHFQAYREELSKKEDPKGKSNPALWIGILTVLSPVISQVMSELGKYLIDIFKGV